jgi:hypothetical protein
MMTQSSTEKLEETAMRAPKRSTAHLTMAAGSAPRS